MKTSIYKLAEQIQFLLGKGEFQEIAESVKQAYASVAKMQFYENKQDGVSDINGSFVYTFKSNTPVLDTDLDLYYIDVPSTYLELPHEFGINQVSFMKGQDTPFVRFTSSMGGMFAGLKANALGGNQVYYVENSRMYFPKFNNNIKGDVLLKLAIALDDVDIDEELNIPPNVADQIIQAVLQRYAPKEEKKPDTLV